MIDGDIIINDKREIAYVAGGGAIKADGSNTSIEDFKPSFALRYAVDALDIEKPTGNALGLFCAAGDKGLAVGILQLCLNYHGYDCGKVDYDFGAQTHKALKAFRYDNYLSGDTVADVETFKYLFKE